MEFDLAPPFIVAVDQSTSATKAIAFDRCARIASRTSIEHKQYYPRPGWVEHDPAELMRNTLEAIRRVVLDLGAGAEKVAALALTNQRETAVVWKRSSGSPLYNAVVWQCGRGKERIGRLRAEGYAPFVKERTGLLLDSYFSASKFEWIVENVPEAAQAARSGDLLFGTIDSWLVWNLTGRSVHATDHSNASRTMLLNLERLDWDDELLGLFGLSRDMAPRIESSDSNFGETNADGAFHKPVPICGVMGDSHGAMFAQRCFKRGQAKVTFGTGSSMMVNIGQHLMPSGRSLVASVGWSAGGKPTYVFEGNIHSTGDTVKWLVDGLGILPSSAASEEMARSVSDNNGVYLVPAFSGLGAPYWDAEAKAIICGMARNTTRTHVVRAALESIAYQVYDLVEAMRKESGLEASELRVDGGASQNDFLMQLHADLLELPIVRTSVTEASALGAALMGGLGMGIWKSLDEVPQDRRAETVFRSEMPAQERSRLLAGWHEAIARAILHPGSV